MRCAPAFVDPFIGTSITREEIFTGWRLHRESLQNIVPGLYQWVDGSFVTAKPDPQGHRRDDLL